MSARPARVGKGLRQGRHGKTRGGKKLYTARVSRPEQGKGGDVRSRRLQHGLQGQLKEGWLQRG